MKFYYNGKQVRTSKNHEYKYAIIGKDEKCWSCHGTLEQAEKEFRKPIAEREKRIAVYKEVIKAIEAGKQYYDYKDGRFWERINLTGKIWNGEDAGDVNLWKRCINQMQEYIDTCLNLRKIVELEMR